MTEQAALLFKVFSVGVVLTVVVGFYALLMTRNLIRALIALEILTKGVTLFIIVCGYVVGQTALAQSLAITLIVIEVAVIVVAVGIVLCIFRHNDSLDTARIRNLKG
jgi:multisubunit Na+/H+ antiporter MnhC subunit